MIKKCNLSTFSICLPGYALRVRGLKIAAVAATCQGQRFRDLHTTVLNGLKLQSFIVDYILKIAKNAIFLAFWECPWATATNLTFLESDTFLSCAALNIMNCFATCHSHISYTIRYDSVCLTCSKKLTGSQLMIFRSKD